MERSHIKGSVPNKLLFSSLMNSIVHEGNFFPKILFSNFRLRCKKKRETTLSQGRVPCIPDYFIIPLFNIRRGAIGSWKVSQPSPPVRHLNYSRLTNRCQPHGINLKSEKNRSWGGVQMKGDANPGREVKPPRGPWDVNGVWFYWSFCFWLPFSREDNSKWGYSL